jgi:GGDEF domain-containing protein
VTAPQENYDPETGLLSMRGFEQAVQAELSRAARHEVPLSLVYLEVTCDGRTSDRWVAAAVAEALVGAVRAEDRLARLAKRRFAVIATETEAGGVLAQRLSDHVSNHLRALGAEAPAVAVASVDCQYDEMSMEELLAEGEKKLAVAILAADDIAFPPAPNGGVAAGYRRAS